MPTVKDKENSIESDDSLLQQTAKGDEAAFEEVVRRYQENVINLAYRYVRDRDAAEDIAAEVFFRIWKNAAAFKAQSKFSTWMYRVTVNVCLNYQKARAAQPRFQYIDVVTCTDGGESKREFPEPSNTQPDIAALENEQHSLVDHIINTLPPAQKMALVLCHFQGHSYSEIAEIMDRSVSSVETLLFRAKENLRQRLKGRV